MVTNEERREVAQKLRDSLTRCSRDDFGDEFEWFTETVCGPIDVGALLELASAMQDDAAICPHTDYREHICSYARQIREALGEEQ